MGINYAQDPPSCIYGGTCTTPGANYIGVPTAVYNKRGHKSWYQGLRYAANNYCKQDPKAKQDYKTRTTGASTATARVIRCGTCTQVPTCVTLTTRTGNVRNLETQPRHPRRTP
ncbi:uncharacterized protein PITG_20106 [Phytophthora infestans T30-4]|uniref:Uncharacterized protein n=1 Tax=Phytophthora infestans (strain T30-4) TaxID=403677 RepID=D0P0S7_PHYIT|nr:uncharacterized protein PITG_20106 [Phytophthora infestans T30-4]EEY53045.1 conserved hypothetical protein [Phytophthora infestans T30-4]|eukprot:XP_002896115.1 conserved hypothetical protein [Phytophthora infestans T30-4]